MTNPIISVKHLKKDFEQNHVLKDINGDINAGQVICIIGPSGSGKSTLLRCINQLERPTSGVVDFNGVDLAQQTDQELAKLGEQIGMVFQNFNLFPNMSVLANLKLAPMRVKGLSDEEATKIAMKYLTSVGLADKADAFPTACLVVKSSVSPSPVRWQCSPRCSSLMNQLQPLILKTSVKF